MVGDADCELVEREVSATPAEFVRGLRDAFPEDLTGGGQRFRIARDGAVLDIVVTPGPDRVIAGLRLPTVQVCIRLDGPGLAARARLLRRLDLATHRGGG